MKYLASIFLFLFISSPITQAQWMELEITEIECLSTEGRLTNDNIYILVDGDKVWQKTMGVGEKYVGFTRKFKTSALIEVWDDDTFDSDDKIGEFSVGEMDIGISEKKERTSPVLKYRKAKYKVRYIVSLDY